MGADPIALPVLDYLVADPRIDFAAVLTQPDRPSGRGKKLRMNPIKAWATEHGIVIGDPDKPGDTELEWIHELGIQFALVMAYGHILKRNLLNAPLLGTWNLHASLLPLHRGASPVESALLAGDTQTGVSLMKIIPKMDAGPVLDIEPVMISLEETSPTLREKLAHACVPLIERNIEKLALGNVDTLDQDDSAATYCNKISKQDGRMDFSMPAVQLERRVRAFTNWPGSFFEYGEDRIKVAGATVERPSAVAPPGTILSADDNGLLIATSENAICFHQLQRPGGRMMEASAFFLGFKMAVGSLV